MQPKTDLSGIASDMIYAMQAFMSNEFHAIFRSKQVTHIFDVTSSLELSELRPRINQTKKSLNFVVWAMKAFVFTKLHVVPS